MAQRQFLFITFCLVLLGGLVHSYQVFKDHFSPVKQNAVTIHRLREQLEVEKLKQARLESQFVDFRTQVAQTLPQLDQMPKTPATFQLRTLASVDQKKINGFELSGVLSERARVQFREGNYKKSSELFADLINKYPTSPLVVQAYFFRAEGLYLQGRRQECLDVVDQMMSQFPENELTGFIMLRMGQILQMQGRAPEASEVFRLVARTFPQNMELKTQAESLAKSVE